MAVCAYVFVCISVVSAANSAKIGFFFRRFKIVLFAFNYRVIKVSTYKWCIIAFKPQMNGLLIGVEC